MLTLDTLQEQTSGALRFIDRKWEELRADARSGHRDRFSAWEAMAASSTDGHVDDTDPHTPYILFLPNDFIRPGGRFMVQFYWDSYFINLSLLRSDKTELAKGMVENCFYLIERHGMVIANRKRWAAGSQLPFLSGMVRDVFESTRDLIWLATAMRYIEVEYNGYWRNSDHLVDGCLSRYHAPSCYPAANLAEITMDHEATWDLSPRFERQDVLHLLPVDLNSNLYAYEQDLAHFSRALGRQEQAERWSRAAQVRSEMMHELMWDEQDGLYYDYDFVARKRKPVRSLVSFFPLFHRLAGEPHAAKVIRNVPLFEKQYGLATCDQTYGFTDRQWNYPVGWAPLHWIALNGMKRYGHNTEAIRVALKWLDLNLAIWKQTGSFFEKYDVERGTHEVLTDRYKNQEGFGWTNAVFHSLIKDLHSWKCNKN
jgi:alpha,alpha-trehalase